MATITIPIKGSKAHRMFYKPVRFYHLSIESLSSSRVRLSCGSVRGQRHNWRKWRCQVTIGKRELPKAVPIYCTRYGCQHNRWLMEIGEILFLTPMYTLGFPILNSTVCHISSAVGRLVNIYYNRSGCIYARYSDWARCILISSNICSSNPWEPRLSCWGWKKKRSHEHCIRS